MSDHVSASVPQRSTEQMIRCAHNLLQLGCVLTVPGHANDTQRQATKSAAEAAGFQVLRQEGLQPPQK